MIENAHVLIGALLGIELSLSRLTLEGRCPIIVLREPGNILHSGLVM